ncbi:PTS sugar transporter subunit IIB [Bombilactobacillus bombi]|uniref:PTS sugar transporter subunit IIB n=1 Tax=Bombilactobacillus bombi TaxID=1303590 RepID=A0A3R6YKA3_9LACO|nr:PTS sugar transporter subunit IIB [Bombilactobacillus bombi]RHW48411.1 PTS sugar transporter subunit IIB [Bombilactobacillus bombi]
MSEAKKILLVCGMGMSSGFLATSARKAAKKLGENYQIEARSETEVSSFLSSIDGLLIGPHYAQKLESFQKQAEPYHVPVDVIPEDIYGMIDGKGLVEFINNKLFNS